MDRLDITIVCGARPDLLARTLSSFKLNLFKNFSIGTAYCNIDKIFGGEDEKRQCVALLSEHFLNPVIFCPKKPSFGAAVKRLWEATSQNYVLHLEDDWILNEEIFPNLVFSKFRDDVGMVQLAIEDRETYGGEYHYMIKRKRIFGKEIFSEKINSYGTSPRFFRPNLARQFGEVLRSGLDPEKQVHKNKNRILSRLHRPWKCGLLYGEGGASIITDTGRDWRLEHSIEKMDIGGRVKWVVAR